MSAGTVTVDADKVLDLLDRIARPLEARAPTPSGKKATTYPAYDT